jgi:hypothetical protein
MRTNAFCYVIRTDQPEPRLLASVCRHEPGDKSPKGTVEPGETIEHDGLRELAEEPGRRAVCVVGEMGRMSGATRSRTSSTRGPTPRRKVSGAA